MKNEKLWHTLNIDEVTRLLGTDSKLGLSTTEVIERLNEYGTNSIPEPKRRSYSSIFVHQFLSPLIYLLLLAALVAFFIGEGSDSLVILFVVILNAIIGAYQEGRAEQSMEALRNLSKLKARVLRDKKEQLIEASSIVPGDVLILAAGDAVPADARLIEVSNVSVSEAALTGESLPVSKSLDPVNSEAPLADRHNMLYAGTYINSGRCIAIVTSTGLNNEIGKIAHLATTTVQPKTQLELRIQQFGRYLIIASVVVFFSVVGIGLVREIPFSQIFMIAISQMVSLVPEGLPVAMTIALAVGVQRMAKKGTIVRRLSAVETLGATTVICTDKTGTLTRNEMTVTNVFLPCNSQEFTVTGIGYEPVGSFETNNQVVQPLNHKVLYKLFEAIVLCNDSQLQRPESDNTLWKVIGDPTEGALLTFAAKAGLDISLIRRTYKRTAELPFSSEVKMMATQHLIENERVIYIKGAPESLLELCDYVQCEEQQRKLDEHIRLQIQLSAKKMADSALRVLAVAYLKNSNIDECKGFESLSGKITLLGLIGQMDPPRSEVSESVEATKKAGIKTIMVTGDHKATGLSIASSLGIHQEGSLAIDGQELEKLSEAELDEKIDHVSVFARVHPAQKLRIVEAFQKKGQVVAMTGDGVNDAPALVRSDVGVAMGITGTEVAKEAAKIVITDDNFATIVNAVAEGRLVYQNIKKLVLFLFVTSIDEVVVLFLALIFGFPIPLVAVQILWINLVTEGTLTVNLIMEPAEGDEMTKPPISSDQPLIDRELLSRIPLMVLASVISTFGWFVYRNAQGIPIELVRTETFTVLAVCQWFNVLNCRSATKTAFSWNLLKNPWLIGGLIAGNILHLAVVYWTPLSNFFHTVPIEPRQFFEIGLVASLVLWVEELRKYIVRKRSYKKTSS